MHPPDHLKPQPAGPAAASVHADTEVAARRILDIGLVAVICTYALSALVGLPLFQDGAWYFFKIATSGVADVPKHH
jgi:hypothetical protein